MSGEQVLAGEGRADWAAMAGIIATVSVFAIAQGLSYPLLSFILNRQGVDPVLIGLSAAMTPVGFIVSAPLIPWFSKRFGPGPLTIVCAGTTALVLALVGWTQDVWLWFPLRFLIGIFANPLYVISETWLLSITPQRSRGRIMGIYTSIVSAGFALGPLTLSIVGTEGWPPFLVGIVAFLLCGLCLTLVMPRLPRIDQEAHGTSVAGFLKVAPLLLYAVFAASTFEQVLLALFAVYGDGYGSSEARIAMLLTIFIAGNVALQVPFGLLAERIGAQRVILACALTALLGCFLLPVLFNSLLVWPMMFVWGAVAFGVYTMALIELGERFSGSLLITGNAAFAFVWGIGGILGPPATGALVGVVGIEGLPVGLGLLCGTLALFHVVVALKPSKERPR